jgi:hypothetical protein
LPLEFVVGGEDNLIKVVVMEKFRSLWDSFMAIIQGD